nr:7319_t:CDS:2 [Entrophospora candida]
MSLVQVRLKVHDLKCYICVQIQKKVVKFVQVEDSVELEPNQTDPSSNYP